MAIFRRDTPAPSPGAAFGGSAAETAAAGSSLGRRAGTGAAVTLIAAGTRLKGEVSGATEVQVEGEIEGNVKVPALVMVSAGGTVRGPIEASVVRVVGKVVGDVTATDRVEVGPAGSLEGDIAAPRVVIAEGAFFRGKIDMKGEQNREPRRPAKAAAETPQPAAEAGSK
jgi:cytoskeletal protein CcmA (bactofilin family)